MINYTYVTLSDLEHLINKDELLAFDTETDGFYNKIVLAQFYQEFWDTAYLVKNPNPISLIKLLNTCTFVAHNAHYDITTLQRQSELKQKWIPKDFIDTFLLARIALPYEQNFDFESLVEKVLGYSPYTKLGLDKKKLQKSNWSGELSKDQELYAASDVYYMFHLLNEINPMMDDINYMLDVIILKYCLDFQWNGMPIDQDKVYSKIIDNKKKIAEIEPPINVNSYQQVRPYIGSEQSDALGLIRLSLEGNEKAEQVLRTRKLKKENSFLTKYEKAGERAYGLFKPSARSGRLTSNGITKDDFNQQQHPRSCKDVFGFKPDEGKVLVYSDFAQLELRTICALTACVTMAELFYKGEDVHQFTADMIGQKRQLTKTYNFNLLYGGGVPMVQSIILKQAEILVEERQLAKDRKKWQNLWKEIYGWQQSGISSWRKGRTKATPLGRRYVGKLMTDHLNIENQGAGAEVSKFALHYMMKRLADNPGLQEQVKLCNFIHDSYIWECPDDPTVYRPLANIVADSMKEAWTEMSKLFKLTDLPMPVDVRVGYNWGDIEKDDYIWRLEK